MNHQVSRSLRAAMMLLALLCAPAVADEVADRAAIEAAAQAWMNAYNAQDVDALIAMSTDDVSLLDPTMPTVKGAQAARKALQNATAKHPVTSRTEEIVINGDIAWRVAALKQKTSGANSRTAPMLEIWQRGEGRWKLRRQMSSGLLARAPLLRQPGPQPRLDSSKP
jgi:ketosteroid isomerase-like protein